jgi:hypothetical protein
MVNKLHQINNPAIQSVAPTDEELYELWEESGFESDRFARAVLARWGNHPGSPDSSALQPISVTERLPGPEDCDAEGRCWAWKLDDEDDAWHLELREWINSPWTTHWLPAHALPQPFCPDPLLVAVKLSQFSINAVY